MCVCAAERPWEFSFRKGLRLRHFDFWDVSWGSASSNKKDLWVLFVWNQLVIRSLDWLSPLGQDPSLVWHCQVKDWIVKIFQQLDSVIDWGLQVSIGWVGLVQVTRLVASDWSLLSEQVWISAGSPSEIRSLSRICSYSVQFNRGSLEFR